MALGWDKSKADGAMFDISRLYIKFHNGDPKSIYKFLRKHEDFAVYVWLVCQNIRPEFSIDVPIELRAFDNSLQIGISTTPECREKAIEKALAATTKAQKDAMELDKTLNIESSLLVIDIF